MVRTTICFTSNTYMAFLATAVGVLSMNALETGSPLIESDLITDLRWWCLKSCGLMDVATRDNNQEQTRRTALPWCALNKTVIVRSYGMWKISQCTSTYVRMNRFQFFQINVGLKIWIIPWLIYCYVRKHSFIKERKKIFLFCIHVVWINTTLYF